MKSLYDDRGKFIGYRCEHCGHYYTQGGRPSLPDKTLTVGSPPRVVPNKAHAKRVQGFLDSLPRFGIFG